jgi:hypothetical protein
VTFATKPPLRGFFIWSLQMKGLLDLTSDDCRWPLDSRCDHDLIMYCGERVGRGSYCVMHADLAYRWERRVPKPKPVEAIAA